MRLRRTTNPYKPVETITGYETVLYGADLYGSDPNEWCAVIDIGKLGRSDFEIEFQWADIQALVDKFHHAGHPEATRLLRGKQLLELVENFQRARLIRRPMPFSNGIPLDRQLQLQSSSIIT